MMKKILIFLLLAVFSLGISAQAPSKKCPVCGLSIPKCQYKGKHPKKKPTPTTPARQQPSKPAKQPTKPVKQPAKPAAKPRPTTGTLVPITVNGVTFNMIKVDGGTFTMGATSEMTNPWDDEKPTHQVTLSSYYIGETEVTQALWKAVMGNNPSKFKGDNLPVEMVSWEDCQDFILKLNSLTGKSFRLPTEAEWEYAARGGKRSNHTQYSGGSRIDDVAWHKGNSGSKTHSVKTKRPNELGLYDMSGNVWEWCQDRYGNYSSNAQTNPTGPDSGSCRVARGGGYCYGDCFCSSSSRSDFPPGLLFSDLGFRLALSE